MSLKIIKKCFFWVAILASNSLFASQGNWEINQITDELTNKKNVFVSSYFTTRKGEILNLSYKCEVLNTKLIGSFELTTKNGFLASESLTLCGKAFWYIPLITDLPSKNATSQTIKIPLANQLSQGFVKDTFKNFGIDI